MKFDAYKTQFFFWPKKVQEFMLVGKGSLTLLVAKNWIETSISSTLMRYMYCGFAKNSQNTGKWGWCTFLYCKQRLEEHTSKLKL